MAGAAVTIVVLLIGRQSPMPILEHVSWSVLPLVAGLFILVEGLSGRACCSRLQASFKAPRPLRLRSHPGS